MTSNPMALPPDLPVPVDDGAADHLPGTPMPALSLPSTAGEVMRVDRVPDGFDRLIIYAYPWTGRPGEPLLTPDWDMIPGARGCTPEACSFRDHAAELREAGAAVVGLSTQDANDQQEATERLHLPFPLLNDTELQLVDALRLPTFTVEGRVLLKRLTLVMRAGEIEHVFYPVFPPNTHAEAVLAWLRAA